MENFQSGFRGNMETALVKIVNDLRLSADKNNVSILILLDLSATFDTIDHSIMIYYIIILLASHLSRVHSLRT